MSAARMRDLDATEAALCERAAEATSEAELRELWAVWRRLTLSWKASDPPWRRDPERRR